jgi:transposase
MQDQKYKDSVISRTSVSPPQGREKVNSKQKSTRKAAKQPKSKENFESVQKCAGTDMSCKKFDICISEKNVSGRIRIKATKSFNNTPSGIKQCMAYFAKYGMSELNSTIVVEATGSYHENFAYACAEAGYCLSIVLPNKSHYYAQSLNSKSKTDEIDARILAQMGLERVLEEWVPANPKYLKMRGLSREKRSLQNDKTGYLNQIHAEEASHEPSKDTLKRRYALVKTIEKQIIQIEAEMKVIVESDPEIKEAVDRLETIKGIAFCTAVTVLAETNGFALFENKAQLVSYTGFDVVKYESGSSVRGRTHISKKGNSHIRAALYMPSMSAMRYDGELRDLYMRILVKNPDKGKKGLVAVQRKMLVLMYSLHKTKTNYDPKYQEKKKTETCKEIETEAA